MVPVQGLGFSALLTGLWGLGVGVEGVGSRTEGVAEIYYRVLVLRVFGFGGGGAYILVPEQPLYNKGTLFPTIRF